MKIKLLGCCVLLMFVLPIFISVLAAAEPVGTSKSFRGPVGLVVYSLRDQIKENGAAALDFAKEQGFVEVEIGLDSHYGLTQEQMKEALKQRGLKPIGAHAGYDFLLKQTDKAAEIANDLGVKYVGVAWAPHKAPLDEAQTLKIAEDFNTIGKRLKEKGIQFYYHNHGYEFQPYKNGETLFDLLVQKTNPDFVKFEMDVLWTIFPGQDPAQLLKKYPDRWILMHLKDLAKGVEGNLSGGIDVKNDVALGSGQVDYPAVLKAAQEIGVKHYFIEDESPDVLKQIPQSLKYLSGIEF
ncbi:MAG: sugar phosphate isomerase/epimerase [Planctomycetaceae bacterium]|jgi:sugar phosphate isomerase/epimerase|nr:sugar phosphate isomerase/epimerase [Planctomycetaceae bacterium]